MNTPQPSSDEGVSLIELIVYVLLSSLVLIATSSILINSWLTQQTVTSVSEATNRGQSMGQTIERAMRNGLDFDVSADGTELRVRTSLGGSLTCQGFRLTAGQARIAQSAGALPASSASWTIWQPGVVQNGATDFFVAAGARVTYTFDLATESASVRFMGEASTRSAATGVSAPCW